MDGNVINLRGKQPDADEPENPLKLVERRTFFCAHESVQIDSHSRSIACTKCGANIDPFDFLEKSAKTIERAWSSYKYAKNAEEEVIKRVDLLKKQEKNLRAQVQRLQGKVPKISLD